MSPVILAPNEAVDELFALLYDELRAIAQRQRRRWRGDDTLQTTALINEAYLKLARGGNWQSRRHFLTAAAYNPAGLFDAMGGRAAAVDRLDKHFRAPDGNIYEFTQDPGVSRPH